MMLGKPRFLARLAVASISESDAMIMIGTLSGLDGSAKLLTLLLSCLRHLGYPVELIKIPVFKIWKKE